MWRKGALRSLELISDSGISWQLGDVFKDSEQITKSVEAYSEGIRLSPSYEVTFDHAVSKLLDRIDPALRHVLQNTYVGETLVERCTVCGAHAHLGKGPCDSFAMRARDGIPSEQAGFCNYFYAATFACHWVVRLGAVAGHV